jgi:hypothetical protein
VYFHSTDWVLARHAPNATPVKIINRMKTRKTLNMDATIPEMLAVNRVIGCLC